MNCSVMSVSIRAPFESLIRSISRTWKDPEAADLVAVCVSRALLCVLDKQNVFQRRRRGKKHLRLFLRCTDDPIGQIISRDET